MRTANGVFVTGFAAVTLLAISGAGAQAPVAIEKSLLGVRILQTYRDVLAKWGQPTLVMRGGERFLTTSVTDPDGGDTGGISSVTYEGGSGSSGGPGGGPGGPGSGGGNGGGMAKGLTPPGGVPGGGMGGGGGGNSETDTSFGASGAYAWIYFNPIRRVYTVFAFNLEGRVMFIMERGAGGGMPTQRGVKLGSTVKSLYDIYGWPDTIQEKDPGFILDYGTKYHAKFAVIKDKVVGIGVVLEESQRLPFFPESGSGGGGGGGGKMGGGKMGGGGGRPGLGASGM